MKNVENNNMTKKTAIFAAACLLIATGATALAAEPDQPGGASATAGESDAAPDASATQSEEPAADAAGPDGDAAGEDKPVKEYRHRPGACPEGPPCKGE